MQRYLHLAAAILLPVAFPIITRADGSGTAASAVPALPVISAIQNNYSYIVPGFPNYGIAPGTLFIVEGTGLADPGASATPLQSSKAPGLPTMLNGASVAVTVNGVTTHPGFYYAIATQLALVLPASTPVGTGMLTVTYNGATGLGMAITVAPVALGLDTYYGTGSGLAVATNSAGTLYTFTNSATPGDVITLWGSGLGAIPADSDTVYTSNPHAGTGPLEIFIGGIQATIDYQGDSGYPGVNQINVTVPSTVLAGCNVSIVALSGRVSSNTVTLPVMPNGGVCSDPNFGTNGTQVQSLSNKNSVNAGFVALFHATTPGANGTTQTNDVAQASFSTLPGSSYSSGDSAVSLGSCFTNQSVSTEKSASTTGLAAGAISVTGPTGTDPLSAESGMTGSYVAQLTSGFIPSSGGSFTFNGTGGVAIGSFGVSLNFPDPLLTWTNTAADTTIDRANGVTVVWSGGGSDSYVAITGTSSTAVNGETLTGSYTCVAPVTAGQFTVPPAILLGLPAGSGSITVENSSYFQTFSAAGLDFGFAFGGVSEEISATYN